MTGVRYVFLIIIQPFAEPAFLQRNIEDILHSYYLATHYDPGWYKAWHTWALSNFSVISYMESLADGKPNDVAGERLAAHVVQAVKGWLALICAFLYTNIVFQASFARSLFAIKMLSKISYGCLPSGSNLASMMKSVMPWGAGFQQ